MILVSHPTGNAYVRNSVQALDEAGLLAQFWTCIRWQPNSVLARVMPLVLQRQFARRTFPDVGAKIRTSPGREIGRLLAPRLGLRALARHETGLYSTDAVFHALDRCVAKQVSRIPHLAGVYAGEDGAQATFTCAQNCGLKTFYDLPIGYWRAGRIIYDEEREREPEWAGTLRGSQDSDEKLARKDAELRLADVVFVASSFTRQTLELADRTPRQVETVPYGAPPACSESELSERIDQASHSGPLKVLFVGSLDARKGLPYLLRAIDSLGAHVELTLIGRKPIVPCAPLERALKQHTWIPSLPHQEVLRQMRAHDVFVFPSLFEGFGLVLLEAMSQGLPVITTTHTAGPDILSEGEDGFIIPVRSPEAVSEKLATFLEQPQLLRRMRFAARRKADSCSWANYREQQQHIFRTILDQPAIL